jgi:uncharacterized membrane protein YdjX (TVP38/TMEM64 family)
MTTLLKILAAVIGVALLVTVGREVPKVLPPFTAWVASLGAWGPLAFIAGYSIAPVVFAPAFILTLAGGAIFGFVNGVIYVMIGATIGSTLAFLTGRYLARHFVEGLLKRDPRLMQIDRAVERHGFRLVALLRMSPAVPFVLLNYALGLSRVKLVDYVAGSIGMLPVVAMYVYSGKVAGDLATLAAGTAQPRGPLYYTMIAFGFITTVIVTIVVTRIAKQAIDQEINETPPEVPSP